MGKTDIGWAGLGLARQGESINPIRARNLETGADGHFCAPRSAGCAACFAEAHNTSPLGRGTGLAYYLPNRDKVEIYWNSKMGLEPFRKREPRGWFPVDMSDWLGWDWRLPREFSWRVLAMAAIAARHRYLLLTKRYAYLAEVLTMPASELGALVASQIGELGLTPRQFQPRLPNPTDDPCSIQRRLRNNNDGLLAEFRASIWFGVSICDMADAAHALPALQAIRAHYASRPELQPIIAISHEPALEAVNWSPFAGLIDWIIPGGESDQGPRRARPMPIEAARGARDFARRQRIPCYFKQHGSWLHSSQIGADGLAPQLAGRRESDIYHWPDGSWSVHLHKKLAGDRLDGETLHEFPDLDANQRLGDHA